MRYRSTMKKPIAKLALCKETIRALIDADLRRVNAGQDTKGVELAGDSGKGCNAPARLDG
jgi:hypothetical protein